MVIYQGNGGYQVREMCLHCAAVPDGWAGDSPAHDLVAEIRRWHVGQNGWRDIGYHFVIAPDGEVARGRPVDQIGAGVVGHNRGVLHVLMVESHFIDRIGVFADFFTVAQKRSVQRLVRLHDLRLITGHNDYAKKLCPGFKVRAADFLDGAK